MSEDQEQPRVDPKGEATYSERAIVEALNEALAEAEREPRTDVAKSFWDRLTDGQTLAPAGPVPKLSEERELAALAFARRLAG